MVRAKAPTTPFIPMARPVTGELMLAAQHLNIDRHDLKSIIIYGFKRSFFAGGYLRKRRYVRDIIDYYEKVERKFFPVAKSSG